MNYDKILKLADNFLGITKTARSAAEIKEQMDQMVNGMGMQAYYDPRYIALKKEYNAARSGEQAAETEKNEQSKAALPVNDAVNKVVMRASSIIRGVESYFYNKGYQKNSVSWTVTVNPDKSAVFNFVGARPEDAQYASRMAAKMLEAIQKTTPAPATAVTTEITKLPSATKKQ
jgi:hypothetical protein